MDREELWYAQDLLGRAVHRLAAGCGSLPVRLDMALGVLHPLRPATLSPELRPLLQELWMDLFAATKETDTSWLAASTRTSHQRRARLASTLLSLYAAALQATLVERPPMSIEDLPTLSNLDRWCRLTWSC